MSKLNEAETSQITSDEKKVEKEMINDEKKNVQPATSSTSTEKNETKTTEVENDKKDILRFTMLFNKYNSDLDLKKSMKGGEENEKSKKDVKLNMFFNKDVTIRTPPEATRSSRVQKPEKDVKNIKSSRQLNFPHKTSEPEFGQPQMSEPDMLFFSPSTLSASELLTKRLTTKFRETENLKKLLNRRNPKGVGETGPKLNVYPTHKIELRAHNSLTSFSKQQRVLKSKIPSLTAIETNSLNQKYSMSRVNYIEAWNEFAQSNAERPFGLQVSRSSNDNRRPGLKFKKEDFASVSDSKLLYTDMELKKQIKKCDKKSRGDSSKKERDAGSRKQVQWKTEVDVIYFSTHLAANGDKTGEVIGRVMEPLREEWEQQRKGFYAKLVPYYMESHLKDRFISLLKI